MASFGASLAKAAGAGLLQYGQFKYQEQLDDKRATRLEQVEAMREANLAKREAARMGFEKAQRAEDRALRKTERGEDRALRAKERGEDMALTREQMAAQEAKWDAQLGQQAHQFKETMGFKRVDDLNGSMDAVYARSQERLDKLEELRLQAAADPMLSANKEGMAAYLAQIDGAKAGIIKDRERNMASLFEANPALAAQSKYYGGESWQNYEAMRKATAQPSVPSPADFSATITPGTPGGNRNSRNEGGGAGLLMQAPQPATTVPSPYASAGPLVRANNAAVPHFAGTAQELDALIGSTTDRTKRDTLQRIRAKQFPGQ